MENEDDEDNKSDYSTLKEEVGEEEVVGKEEEEVAKGKVNVVRQED